MNKVYFPNLNGLRFLAAFLVIIHHIEQSKDFLGLNNYWSNSFVHVIGKLGVILFFVLSGYLITYLLLVEEKQTDTISVKDFYLRRILRIWPLYYLVIILSFFIFSRIEILTIPDLSSILSYKFGLKLFLFVFFLPNLALILFPPVPYASQAWSVGVEEQFYLIWPVLMKKFKNKERLLYSVIFGYLTIKLGLKLLKTYTPFWNKALESFGDLWYTFSIDCMAIGGLFAFYLFKKDKIIKILFNKYLQASNLLILITLIGFGITIPFIHNEFYAILFGILILNLSANINSLISLENTLFNYLGKISYGLYMYHGLGIIISLKVLNGLGLNNIFIQYIVSTLVTVIIAGLSFRFFEKFFINKKEKFSKVISGADPK